MTLQSLQGVKCQFRPPELTFINDRATQEPTPTNLSSGAATLAVTDVFDIPNMDCRSEEAAIRTRLATMPGVESLRFDLPARRLAVTHRLDSADPFTAALREIGMHATARGRTLRDPCGTACTGACGSETAQASTATSLFSIPNMDCRSEEAAIRARLAPLPGVRSLDFNLDARRLGVVHAQTDAATILQELHAIGMQASLADDSAADAIAAPPSESATECGPCAQEPLVFLPPSTGRTTVLRITNMDCPTEEALTRKRLGKVEGIDRLDFDLMNRRLALHHHLGAGRIARDRHERDRRSRTCGQHDGQFRRHGRPGVLPDREDGLPHRGGDAAQRRWKPCPASTGCSST